MKPVSARIAIAIGAVLCTATLAAACSSRKSPATPSPSASATAPAGGTETPRPTTTANATPSASASATPATASEPPAYDDTTDPLRMLTSYFNAIDRHDYQRAYNYWRNPSQGYTEFAKGYANTAAVVATLAPASAIDAGAGQRRMLIAAVLNSTLDNGQQQQFAGCYVAWRVAEGISSNPADNSWHIEEASVKQVSSGSLANLLASACTSYKDRVSAYDAAYDNTTGAVNVVASLYDAINRQDYQRAFNYWAQPPTSFDQYKAGFANTKSSVVTFGSPLPAGAAAGSIYVPVPVVVTATSTDGSVHTFSGCYLTRRSNIPQQGQTNPSSNPWSIYSGQLTPAPAGSSPGALLAADCASERTG